MFREELTAFVSTLQSYATSQIKSKLIDINKDHLPAHRYGDKAPKSILARVFSMIWIQLGLIIMAIFTANVTSTLTALSLELEPSDLVGKKVCTIKIRRHSCSLIILRKATGASCSKHG